MTETVHVALLALLAWVPMPWASNPQWARALFTALVAALVLFRLALARYGAPIPELPRAARLSLQLWLAWLAWLALQMLPLPGGVVRVVSPASFAAHDALAGIGGGAFTLSLEPGLTLDQWLLSAALFGLHWLVLVTASRHRKRQRAMLQLILLSGLGQALYGIVMTLSDIEVGFFAAKTANLGYTTGTFVNKNHFAAYLALCLGAGIALVLADLRERRWQTWRDVAESFVELALSQRLLARLALVIPVIALVLTRSRMGNGAFFMALGACGSAWVLLRQRQYFLPGLALFASLFLIDLWIVSDRYGLEKLQQRIEQTDLAQEDRASAFMEILPLVREYALTGSGLGTFADAYSPVRSEHITAWYNHAHNDHLEFLVEVGVAGYALLCAMAGLVLWHAVAMIRRRHDPMPCALGFAGAMAVLCVALGGLTDFALQIPAVAATAVALMALTLSSSSQSSARHSADRQDTRDLPAQVG